MTKIDVLIIGAGAAGLFCAMQAAKRGRNVLVLEKANKPGKKILMSGGGRCNFTNYYIEPEKYISHNPHFCKSALSRYTQWDFIELVKKHNISFHEKTLGQLFCDYKSKAILQMLLDECEHNGAKIQLNTDVQSVSKLTSGFEITTEKQVIHCESLVIASGGLSIPSMGASPFGFQIAEQFGLKRWPTKAALVPLTLHVNDKERYSLLSGVSLECIVTSQGQNKQSFREYVLFTHRGLSGPAILQISSYWNPGELIHINMLPHHDLEQDLIDSKQYAAKRLLKTKLAELLPKSIIDIFMPHELLNKSLAEISHKEIKFIAKTFHHWQIKPNGTEGYRTAEVTLGGVDTAVLSSKTMAVKSIPSLYFIGEVVDVTGWLGGYNFQWAWSSAAAAGQVV